MMTSPGLDPLKDRIVVREGSVVVFRNNLARFGEKAGGCKHSE